MRKFAFLAVFVLSAVIFGACNDESENILPQPGEEDQVSATVGNEGVKDDID